MNKFGLEKSASLDEYVYETQMNKLYTVYMPFIKTAIFFWIFVAALWGIIHATVGLDEGERNHVLTQWVTLSIALGVVSYLLIILSPKLIIIVIPGAICIMLSLVVKLTVASETYVISEYMFTIGLLTYNIAISIPHLYTGSRWGFILAMVYYWYAIYSRYGYLPSPLLFSWVWNIVHFYVGTKSVYSQFRTLYQVILKNENLVQEMKRFVEIFPESVLICKNDVVLNTSSVWCNNQFEKSICDVKQSIQKLKNHRIEFVNFNTHQKQILDVNTPNNLYDLIMKQQSDAEDGEWWEQQNLSIECDEDLSDLKLLRRNSDSAMKQKRFFLKTLRINWEGNDDAYMHVFIDTTQTVKLEEAHNNMKCQRIMFANASHEFRTPLNSIINSYEFIESSFKLLCKNLSQEKLNQTLLSNFMNQTSQQLNKFIHIGRNSSVMLLSLIEDILNLSKIEMGTFAVNIGDFEIDGVLNEITDLFKYQWDQKQILLEISWEQSLKKLQISSDRELIKKSRFL